MITRPEHRADIEGEQPMSLLSHELSKERIRDAERTAARRRDIAQIRALRVRRDAATTAARLRRLLTTR